MNRKTIREILKLHLPGWGVWTVFCFISLVFFAELYFFTSYNYELVDGAYKGTVITRVVIQKQEELIKTQCDYIDQLKSVNKVLAERLVAAEDENADLKNDIVVTFGPFAESLGYHIVFLGGRAFVRKDDGTVGFK